MLLGVFQENVSGNFGKVQICKICEFYIIFEGIKQDS